ncbi:MAG: alpha-2-macroglobulin, partial [Prevotella sp.]|nr:alpha-2-macroglobulin [Prevotella sp.]
MKKIVSILIFLFMAITMSGNAASYEELWKKVMEAGAKDLPKTQYEQLQKIVKKAESERVYGQLLKAELQSMQVMNTISPDSLKPAVERLQQRVSQTADPVLQTVRRTVLYRICKENRSLEMTAEKPVLTAALCQQLGSVKDETMKPFVIEGADSRIFGHDLLSIVGYELEDYAPLHIYYEQQGNREAALFTALELWRQQKNEERKNRLSRMNSACLASLDSLIAVYADLPEAGELALERYDYMEDASGVSSKEKYEYLNSAIEKWGNWPRISQLSNRRARLTTPSFSLSLEHAMAYPQQEQNLELHGVRNVDSVTLTIRRLSVNGDTDLNPSRQEDYAKLMKGASKPLSRITRSYAGKAPYEETEDSIPLMPLSAGVYLFELESAPATEKICRLFYVTDVYTIAQAQPDNTTRYVVVSARTGQPLPDARLYIRQYKNYREYTTSSFRVGKNGEYIYKRPESGRIEVWACTPDDKGCPLQNLRSSYYYNGKVSTMEETCVYTDRAIYRPGQTVHVAAIVYQVANGKDHKALEGKTVTMTLRDANYKEVKQLQLTTDKYGTCSADFTLPQNGLTGRYTLQVNQQMESIRVEEYKRPTFEVSFESVKDNYKAGDTVMARGTAQTYAGVPVQGAKVKYRVERRFAFWWLSYSRYWGGGYFGRDSEKEALCEGETETDEQGAFSVPMPLTMPESEYPLFYTFVAECDVTDQGGETHSNSYSLPLGNRKTALSIGVSEKVLTDSEPSISFHLRNAAGNEMEGMVRYRIDGGKWKTVSTQKSVSIGKMASGTHVVEAIYGDAEIGSTDGNYAKREFVAFSLDDKRPACKTDDWFYLSSTTFPNDGTPITLQAGSSADDVHIVYSIFSGEKVLESGAVDLSDALINRKLTYREDWGNGILLSYAWVKDGRCYQHSQSIRRPLPNKRLNLTWETFRDRLKPGQQEEWTLSIKNPDGTPADAHLIATLYDKSLDQLAAHDWSLTPRTMLALPSMGWGVMGRYSLMGNAAASVKISTVQDLYFS